MFPYPKPFHKFCMHNLLMTLLGEWLRIILLRGKKSYGPFENCMCLEIDDWSTLVFYFVLRELLRVVVREESVSRLSGKYPETFGDIFPSSLKLSEVP